MCFWLQEMLFHDASYHFDPFKRRRWCSFITSFLSLNHFLNEKKIPAGFERKSIGFVDWDSCSHQKNGWIISRYYFSPLFVSRTVTESLEKRGIKINKRTNSPGTHCKLKLTPGILMRPTRKSCIRMAVFYGLLFGPEKLVTIIVVVEI